MIQRRLSLSRGVLVDTSAYFAFADRDDVNRSAAQDIFRNLAQRRVRLFTTDLVVAETHALILRRLNRPLATRFLRGILEGTSTIVWVAVAEFQRAIETIELCDDKDYSLTDATSFAVMEHLGITHAFTFDRHFAQYGFQVLTSP